MGMGFKRKRKLYKLTFADPDMDGLQVTMHAIPVGVVLELQAASEKTDGNARLFEIMSEALVEWNLENEDGTPVPATKEGVMTQDMDFVMAIITSWTEAISGVSAPLASGSTSGETFPEASLPMAVL